MLSLAPPTGGLYLGKRLQKPPRVVRLDLGLTVRAAFVTDVHISRNYPLRAARALIDQIIALQPDILLLGGDYAESRADCEAFFLMLADVNAPLGKFAVAGNNDTCLYGAGAEGRARLARAARAGGVSMLFDESVTLPAPGGAIELAGAHDAYEDGPPLPGSLFRAKSTRRVLLAHQPLVEYARVSAPQIMLCGHMHGGQINVCGLTCFHIVGYEKRFRYTHIAGLKSYGNTRVFVSRGIGVSKWPIRFGARPEIYLLS